MPRVFGWQFLWHLTRAAEANTSGGLECYSSVAGNVDVLRRRTAALHSNQDATVFRLSARPIRAIMSVACIGRRIYYVNEIVGSRRRTP